MLVTLLLELFFSEGKVVGLKKRAGSLANDSNYSVCLPAHERTGLFNRQW